MDNPWAICNLVIIALTGYYTYQGLKDPVAHDKLIFDPVLILRDKQYYRLVSSGFLHADWWHFFLNMFSLYSFGSSIETLLGPWTFLPIYFAGIVGGNLLSLYLHRHHYYRALGASGGVCGIIFASIFLLPVSSILMFPVPIPIPTPVYAILFLILSFIGMRTQTDNIGHDAHLGGALIGLLTATLLHPYIISLHPVLYTLIVVITGVLFLYTYMFPVYLQVHSPLSRAHWEHIWQDMNNSIRNARLEQQNKVRQAKEEEDQETLDRLLDKISKSGMDSLTAAEKNKLKSISQKRP